MAAPILVELLRLFSRRYVKAPEDSKAIVQQIADVYNAIRNAKSRSSSRKGMQWTKEGTARTETPF